MTSAPPPAAIPEDRLLNLTRELALLSPVYLLVPVIYGLLALVWDIQLNPGWLLAGVAGWLVALLLRAPVSLVTRRLTSSDDTLRRVIILSSGPAEELVRLVLVLIAVADLDIAYAIGLGWGAVEVIYALINGFVIASLLKRTDDEALQARKLMEEMGLLQAGSRPIYGVIERFAATALHIGFTLLLAFQPLLVLLTVPVHSLANYILVSLMQRRVNVLVIQLSLLVLGLLMFGLGLAVFGVFG